MPFKVKTRKEWAVECREPESRNPLLAGWGVYALYQTKEQAEEGADTLTKAIPEKEFRMRKL